MKHLALATAFFGIALSAADLSFQEASGNPYNLADLHNRKATVFVFVGTDCPNSNTYAPVLARLYQQYSARGIAFFNVYSDPAETAASIRKHDSDFHTPFPALLDPKQVLARKAGVHSTPEVALLSPDGNVLYRGRVDDRFVDWGKTRFQPTQEDLREALDAILEGKSVPHRVTKVLGCAIPGVN